MMSEKEEDVYEHEYVQGRGRTCPGKGGNRDLHPPVNLRENML